MRFPWAISSRAIGLGVICVVGMAMVIAARQLSPTADMAAVEAQPQKVPAMPAAKKMPVTQAQAKETSASKAPAAAVLPTSTLAADATAAKTPMVESASRVQEQDAVTITGCLERDDEKFRLKETTGTDAPKSRSWKSGFLKKSTASIEVVDAANRLKLPNHVGQRVSITGVLLDREIQVHSLQRVASSCA